jgi:hypothetical protein
MYYMFRPAAAIIRSTELSQSPFCLSAEPPYSDQSLHISSALYRYVVDAMLLCCKIYEILKLKFAKIF